MIELTIKNLKGISDFHISLPYEKGVYVITGENGVGKSTILSVLSQLVYKKALTSTFKYQGDHSTSVVLKLDGLTNTWIKQSGQWKRQDTNPLIECRGTLESSVIFGNRFADANKNALKNIGNVRDTDLVDAAPFVKENLGIILRNDKNFYSGLKRIRSEALTRLGFNRVSYFWINNEKNSRVSQLFMSSGEMLLLGLLDFLNGVIHDITSYPSGKNIVLIDEIELALHSSSAKKLIELLRDLSSTYEVCIYIATHSVHIINDISPSKIYYIQRNPNNNLEVIPNCYPAYATRSLYTDDGFDFLILVEDKLAKYIVNEILKEKHLYTSRLVKILSSGGWEQTLQLHIEFQDSSIAGKSCKVISILDGDIEETYKIRYEGKKKKSSLDSNIDEEDQSENQPKKHRFSSLPKIFLPIKSIEKYIKEKLVTKPDATFFKIFGDDFYASKSLTGIIDEYQNELLKKEKKKDKEDNDGKFLWEKLKYYALTQGLSEDVFENNVCQFVYKQNSFVSLENFLIKKLTDTSL
jgi:predicted ATPase